MKNLIIRCTDKESGRVDYCTAKLLPREGDHVRMDYISYDRDVYLATRLDKAAMDYLLLSRTLLDNDGFREEVVECHDPST